MADFYAKQQVGVADGTQIPPNRADGREVGAYRRTTLASKVPGTNWTTADKVFLGTKPAGSKIVDIRVTADTSFGTSTLSIGTLAAPAKYVNGRTNTTVNLPTSLGPLASTMDDDPGGEEDIWLTIGTAAIAAATLATFELTFVGI